MQEFDQNIKKDMIKTPIATKDWISLSVRVEPDLYDFIMKEKGLDTSISRYISNLLTVYMNSVQEYEQNKAIEVAKEIIVI